LLVGAMALWGLNLTAVKALTASFDPLLVAVLRMVVAFVALSALALWRRCPWPDLSLRQWGSVVACGALMVYLNQILLAEGLLRSSAANAAMIMVLSPLVSVLMASAVYRERLTLRVALGVALGFGGVAVVTLSRPEAQLVSGGLGDLMMVGAVCMFSAGGIVIQKLAQRVEALIMSWAIFTSGAAMLVLHALISPTTSLDAQTLFPAWTPWLWVLYSGAIATAMGNLIWNRAIGVIGAARTALYLYWVPIFGIAFAVLLLGEPLTIWHPLGLLAVLAGTFVGTRPTSSRRPGPRRGRPETARR
jgi:drug/metabolite transporter (DMT)-like permease